MIPFCFYLLKLNDKIFNIEHTKCMEKSKKKEIKKIEKFKRKNKIGLCLSGGGTRGFAFVGAFKAFEENGIEFDAVSGCSVGSLFAALYASKMKSDEIVEKTKNFKNKDFRNSKLGFLPSKMDNMIENLENLLPIKQIGDLKIPYYAVAVDLRTGREIDFSSGTLSSIIAGSCSIPGVFFPVKYKKMVLIDGGVANNVPVDILRDEGCDYVVTIDCNSTRGGGTKSDNLIVQFTTSVGIMMANNSKKGLELSDIVISPDMKEFSSLKLEGKEKMIKEGYRATMEMMPEIKKLFMGKYKKKMWKFYIKKQNSHKIIVQDENSRKWR